MGKRENIRIGEIASRAGVSVATLRFYERRGLMPPPGRTEDNNYRAYDEAALDRVASIKRMQDLGFTLKEIVRVLSAGQPADLVDLARAKLAEVEKEAVRVQRARVQLRSATTGRGAAVRVHRLLMGGRR